MKNYSKQREAIIRVLQSSKTHPTAREIYEMVRKELPNISLGTVYRNLAALSCEGDILSIAVGDGFEHFDGDVSPHLHLHCRKCGHTIDVPLKSDIAVNMAEKQGFKPDSEVYVVYGICSQCNGSN